MGYRRVLGGFIVVVLAGVAAGCDSEPDARPAPSTPVPTATGSNLSSPAVIAAIIPGALHYRESRGFFDVVNGGGYRQVAATSDLVNNQDRISPDGRRVASIDGRTGALLVANVDGTGVRSIDAGDHIESIDWSPDSTRLVYRHESVPTQPSQGASVRVINADGTGKKVIGADGDFPTWSADGGWIVYASGRENALFTSVTRVRPDGVGATTTTRARLGEKAWVMQVGAVSPDASRVLVYPFCQCDVDNDYRHFRGSPYVSILDTVTGESQRPTSSLGTVDYALWTSDGRMLVRITSGERGTPGSMTLELRGADGTVLARQVESNDVGTALLTAYQP